LVVGSQLIAPLFDGGQRRAEVDRTAALLRQRFDEYGQTVLNSLREVEDSLALERYQIERLEHLEKQTELARQAAEQLQEERLFDPDLIEYLDVLSSITAAQRLERDTLSARLELLSIRVGLYLALAGGFDPRPNDLYGGPLCYPFELPAEFPVEAGQEMMDSEVIEKPEPIRETDGLLEIDVIPEARELPIPEPDLESEPLPAPLEGLSEIDVDE
jgi:hypothetical protein